MPQYVCTECRVLFEHSYRFKQMCKRAETLLRQVPLTGEWPDVLPKPRFPTQFISKPQVDVEPVVALSPEIEPSTSAAHTEKAIPQRLGNVTIMRTNTLANARVSKPINEETNRNAPKKILNANPATSPEPPVPKRFKKEIKPEEEDATTIFLNKVDNDEELSIDDLHRLIEANSVDDDFVSDDFIRSPQKVSSKPKLLNKSSIRILNKEADIVIEPQFSKPEVKRDKDGNVAIVTEIIDPNTEFNADLQPLKEAEPVETNVFPCPHCERSFPLRQLRDIHIVNHNRERSNPCPDCDKSFFSKYDLQKHALTHSGDKPFKCSCCDKAFTRATLLHRHEKTHTDIPKFICLHCEKPFISREEMEKHSVRHLKNRPYQCSVCAKSFAFKQGLERHFVVHSTDQPYPCHYCEQSFPTSSKLARHLTAHAGSRPYPCKFCPKSFLLSHHLTRHLRSHKSSASSYVCNSCNKTFDAREELIRHSAQHAKDALNCPLCREELALDNVEEHIEAHVTSEAFACEFCDLIFMTADRLQLHADTDHADEMVAYIEDDKKQQKQKEQQQQKQQKTTAAQRKKTTKLDVEKEAQSQEGQQEEDELFQNLQEFFQTDPLDIKPDTAVVKQEVDILEDLVLSGPAEEAQPPASKMRRVAAKVGVKKIPEKRAAASSPPMRRKVASTAKITESKATTEITSMLRTLPKTVSVRRNATAATSPTKEATNKNAGNNKQSPNVGTPSSNTRRSREAAAQEPTTKVDEETIASIKKTASKLQSPGATTSNSDTGKMPLGQLSKKFKMMIGDKKVNVQKITLSKAEAAAMAKQGRLRIKDGNIVLTNPPKSKEK